MLLDTEAAFSAGLCWRPPQGNHQSQKPEMEQCLNLFHTKRNHFYYPRNDWCSTLLSFMYEHWIYVKQDSTVYGAGIFQYKGMDGQTGYLRGPSLAPKGSRFHVSSFVEPRTQAERLLTVASPNIIPVYEPCAEQSVSIFMVPTTWPVVTRKLWKSFPSWTSNQLNTGKQLLMRRP